MLDADGLASVPIRPTRDVSGGENSRRARFEKGVDDKAAVNSEASGFRKAEPRAYAKAGER